MFNWLYTDAGVPDWKWIVTAALALYGAVVTTYRELQARLLWKPNAQLTLNLSIVAVHPGALVGQVQAWISNHGRSDIHFNSANFSIQVEGWDRNLFVVDPISNAQFPHTMKPGMSFYLMKEKAPLIENLRASGVGSRPRIRAVIYDALNRPYYSPWQVVDLNARD
jgi:hypothetical protein